MRVSADPDVLVGFCLALVRSSAFLTACPVFNGPWIPFRIRVGLAMAVSLVLMSAYRTVDAPAGLGEFVVALVAQALAGAALGICVLVAFAAVQAAGDLIDLQIGFSFGGQLDPLSGVVSAPVARMFQMVGVAVVFAANGHLLLLHGFLRSVRSVPVGGVDVARAGEQLLGLVSSVLVAAIEIALPLVATMLCAEVVLGLLGKAAPQLNVLVLGFAAKTAIAVVLLVVILVALPEATMSLVERGLRAGFEVLG